MPVVRRQRSVVRKFDLVSVVRVAVLFHISAFIVMSTAGVVLWKLASAQGWIVSFQDFIKGLLNLEEFIIHGDVIFVIAALFGLVLAVIGTAAWVLFAVLYNLISDVVGGVGLTVLEEERTPPTRAVAGSNPSAAPVLGR